MTLKSMKFSFYYIYDYYYAYSFSRRLALLSVRKGSLGSNSLILLAISLISRESLLYL